MNWKIVCLMACTLVIVGMCQNVMADFSLIDEINGFKDNPLGGDYPKIIEDEENSDQTPNMPNVNPNDLPPTADPGEITQNTNMPSGNPGDLPPTADPETITPNENVNNPNPGQTVKLPSDNPIKLPGRVDTGEITPINPPVLDDPAPLPDDNDPNTPEDTQGVTNHEFDVKLPIVGSLGFIFGCLVVAVLMAQKRRK